MTASKQIPKMLALNILQSNAENKFRYSPLTSLSQFQETLSRISRVTELKRDLTDSFKNYLSRRCSGFNSSALFFPVDPFLDCALSRSRSLWLPRGHTNQGKISNQARFSRFTNSLDSFVDSFPEKHRKK